MTADSILLGFEYSGNNDAANAAIGASGITTGDQMKQTKILIDAVNASGGIAGRTVKPYFHSIDATGSTQSEESKACQDFTQDHVVFAVVTSGKHTENYVTCLNNAGTPLISAPGLTENDAVAVGRYPLYRELNTLDLSRQGELYGEAMASTGYYDRGAKIGLLTLNKPSFQREVSQHLEPALARVGQRVEKKVELTYPDSTDQVGSFSAAIGNAILTFRRAGVDHVIITDIAGLTTLLFLNAASNQKYYPRYGFVTQNGGQTIADSTQDKKSLENSVQLGWSPGIDLNAANETISPPGKKRCLDIYAAKGVRPDSRNAEALLEADCDLMFFAQAAGNRANPLTAQNFVQAFNGVGGAIPPAGTYKISLSGRATGVAAYRVQRWVTNCTCYQPEGGLRPVP